MGMQNNGGRARALARRSLSNISPFCGGTPISRASLLATASLSAAQAQFGGMNRITSGPVTGPIFSNGRAITVTVPGASPAIRTSLSPHLLDHETDEPRGDKRRRGGGERGGRLGHIEPPDDRRSVNQGLIDGGAAQRPSAGRAARGCRTPGRSPSLSNSGKSAAETAVLACAGGAGGGGGSNARRTIKIASILGGNDQRRRAAAAEAAGRTPGSRRSRGSPTAGRSAAAADGWQLRRGTAARSAGGDVSVANASDDHNT